MHFLLLALTSTVSAQPFEDKLTNVEDMLINWTQLRLELQSVSEIDGSLQLKKCCLSEDQQSIE